MEFPLKSLGAFLAGFGSASLAWVWVRIRVLEWYESKWSPEFNFGVDTIGMLLVVLPIAGVAFSLAAYLVNSPYDRWRPSLFGSVVLAALFSAVTQLSSHLGSDVLALSLVWGTLLLGSAGIGAYVRLPPRSAV
jgi:hypothetical protein